jgi:ketosteroid isomerase-like protein
MMIASLRERVASGARAERRLLGIAGERVAVGRMLWTGGPADGRFEIEYISVFEADESGLLSGVVIFELDDARAAQREAWARWAAIDPDVAPSVELLNEIIDAWNGRDRTALLARFADDLVVEDHRLAGIGRIEGAAAYVDANAVLWDLAPDQRIEFGWSWLAWDRHGLVATLRRVGTLADGGAFESEYVWLSLASGGRITHLELFEIDAHGAALARFEELRPRKRSAQQAEGERSPSDPLRIPPNAATRAVGRIAPLYSNADLPALRAIVSDDFVFDDRTRGSLLRGGVEEWVSGLRFLRTETRARLDSRLVATAGERLALIHLSWREAPGESSFLIERFGVYEIDATGKLRAFVLFDVSDRAAAYTELFERYAASGSDGSPAAALEFERGVNAHDLERVRAVLPRDFVFDDHRRTGLGRLEGPDAYLQSVSAYWGLSPDLRLDMLYGVAAAPHGRVGVGRTWGTNAEGGEFESVYVSLLHHPQDRLAGIELFEPEDLDVALARFEALRPDPLSIPPTAAMRMRDRHRDAFVARDWDAIRALAGADFVFEDRGRRALVHGDVEAWIASMEFTAQPGFRAESTLIGALGDRIALDHLRWFGKPDGDAFEFERVRLLEVGADGLFRAVFFFDPEDRFAASIEGLARFAQGEAAGSAGIAPLVALYRALGDRSWQVARDCFAPDLIFVDHRPLGLGTLDREQWIASMQAVDELGDGVIWEVFRVLAWSEQGFVVAVRRFGTIADGGGPFEVDAILTRLVVDGRIRRVEVFGESDAERAVARFAELCGAAPHA